MGFLEVGRSELCTRNLRGDCQHGHPVTLTVEETIDEVQIAWSTTTRTDRKLPAHVSVGASRERSCLFVADVQPLNIGSCPDRVRYTIQ